MNSVRQVLHKCFATGIDNVFGAETSQNIDLLLAAHNIDDGYAVSLTNFVEHLPKIGSGCRVHDRCMVFHAHGLEKAKRG